MEAVFGPGAKRCKLSIEEAGVRTQKAQELGGHGRDEESVNMTACPGRVLLQHAGAIAAANAGTMVGLALGWSAAALEVLHGAQGFPVTLEQWSWVSSLMPIGAAVGAMPAGRLVQSLGRKAVILGLGPVTLAAWLLHLWASSVWMLYAGRLLLGAAVGAAIVAAPIFVAEMAQPAIRGALSTYFQILLCVGILAVYACGKFLPIWWLNVCCLSTSVLHVLGFAWFPDTPRWYLLRGRPEDARKAMLFYRGPHYDVDAELQQVQRAAPRPEGREPGPGRLAGPGLPHRQEDDGHLPRTRRAAADHRRQRHHLLHHAVVPGGRRLGRLLGQHRGGERGGGGHARVHVPGGPRRPARAAARHGGLHGGLHGAAGALLLPAGGPAPRHGRRLLDAGDPRQRLHVHVRLRLGPRHVGVRRRGVPGQRQGPGHGAVQHHGVALRLPRHQVLPRPGPRAGQLRLLLGLLRALRGRLPLRRPGHAGDQGQVLGRNPGTSLTVCRSVCCYSSYL